MAAGLCRALKTSARAAPARRRARRVAPRAAVASAATAALAQNAALPEVAAGNPLGVVLAIVTFTYLFTTVQGANQKKSQMEKDIGLQYEDFMALVKGGDKLYNPDDY